MVADPVFPQTEHFRDGRFFNPGVVEHGFREALRWMTNRKPGVWRKWIDSVPGPPPPQRVEGAELLVTFVNHSTVLLQTEGCNILTDPVWSRRVSPVQWTGPERHRDPGIRFDDLPEIDCLLITHNHYDHFDRPTLRRLAQRGQPAVFCPLGLAKLLRQTGFRNVQELDWGQCAEWKEMRIHCTQAQHFSGRGLFDRNRTLWCGWLLETAGGNLYYAGDTGFGSFWDQIREQFAPIRLALLPIGAYEPEWFMGPVHMTPEEAVAAWDNLGAATAVAMHYGTFALADDGESDPVDRLRNALRGRHDAGQFLVVPEGEGRVIV